MWTKLKLPESTKTQPNIEKLNKNIQKHNETIKKIYLQLENQDRNYVRNTIERIENNLQAHEEKIKKKLNSDKAADQKIKEILNILESFQDNGNRWLTVGKKEKILYDEETPVNELQRKQVRSKKLELVIFGDSINKRIDPSFIARCDKSLALNYSVGGAKVRGVYEQMRTFRDHQEAAVSNVIIHVDINHLSRGHSCDITTKISKILLQATKEFPNTWIYFSAILPKFNNTFFEMINHVNSEIFKLCSYFHQLRFIQHQDLNITKINKELFWKDMSHTSDNGLPQLARDFIKPVRFRKFS